MQNNLKLYWVLRFSKLCLLEIKLFSGLICVYFMIFKQIMVSGYRTTVQTDLMVTGDWIDIRTTTVMFNINVNYPILSGTYYMYWSILIKTALNEKFNHNMPNAVFSWTMMFRLKRAKFSVRFANWERTFKSANLKQFQNFVRAKI